MIAVAFSLEGTLVRTPPGFEVAALLDKLHALSMPLVLFGNGRSADVHADAGALGFRGTVLSSEDAGAELPSIAAFAAIASACSLPADRIWFVTGTLAERHAARTLGFQALLVTDGLSGILDAIGEPYTRALLELRYTMRTALEWRRGHTIDTLPAQMSDPSGERKRS